MVAVPAFRGPILRASYNARVLFSVIRKTQRITTPSIPRRSVHTRTHSDDRPNVFQSPYVNELFWELSKLGPAFQVNSDDVEFLRIPQDFYEQLKAGISSAKKRVVLASLYLGNGEREQALVDVLIDACTREPALSVTILLDGLRGTRWMYDKSMPKPGRTSSAHMLLPLVQKFPDRARVFLFHTPNLKGMWKAILPQRYNETLGVSHIKTYITDDSLLMSGANLSSDYFTERQDRYAWFRNASKVADFFHYIVDSVGTISYRLSTNGDLLLADKGLDPAKQSGLFTAMAATKMSTLLKPHTFYHYSDAECPASSTGPTDPAPLGTGSSSPVDVRSAGGAGGKAHNLTWVFPTIQMGTFGIRQDEDVTSRILNSTQPFTTLYITSPYFNLTNKYVGLLLGSRGNVDIICASPKANGFFGAAGLAGAITSAYTAIEKQFFDKVVRGGHVSRILLSEYTRSGWTFHAKGLWLTQPNEQVPCLASIGSPNFGGRSVEKDLEAQLILVTDDPVLKRKMDEERRYLWSVSERVDEHTFKREDRRVHPALWATARIAANFL